MEDGRVVQRAAVAANKVKGEGGSRAIKSGETARDGRNVGIATDGKVIVTGVEKTFGGTSTTRQRK